jgi:DNA-binding NarL/FixJ family response regulator
VSSVTGTVRESERSLEGPFSVVVLSGRAIVQAMFTDLGRRRRDAVSVTVLPMSAGAIAGASDVLGTASVAVLDASVSAPEALAACEALRAECPSLPVAAVFCCPHSTSAADLRALLVAGADGLLDLELPADETLRMLRDIARGQGTCHLQLAADSSTSLRDFLSNEPVNENLSERDLGILRLVTLGYTDQEIGRELFLSHHTVKHRIDRLRRQVGARNRIQLAAWAGGQATLRSDGNGWHANAGPPLRHSSTAA